MSKPCTNPLHTNCVTDGQNHISNATVPPTGRMATPKELEAASKKLSKQIDENIDVFKRLADK